MKHTEPHATSECLSGDTIFACISAVSTSEQVYLASVVWLYMDQHDWDPGVLICAPSCKVCVYRTG